MQSKPHREPRKFQCAEQTTPGVGEELFLVLIREDPGKRMDSFLAPSASNDHSVLRLLLHCPVDPWFGVREVVLHPLPGRTVRMINVRVESR